MYRERKVCVVVPAYNEESHIGAVIAGSPSFVDSIVVVDDHSSDRTGERALAAGDPRVVLIRHEHNQGVGGALVTGYQRALALGADVVVVMAGDDQMDPAFLPSLLDPICAGQSDMAKGNRFYGWESLRHMPKARLLGTLFLTWLTRVATGYWSLQDAQNGYVAISATVLSRLKMSAIARGYAVENAMLIELARLRARVVDVSIPARYGTEVSGMRIWRDGPMIAGVVLRACAARMRRGG